MTRYVICVLTLTLFALAACTPFAQPTQAPEQPSTPAASTAARTPTQSPGLPMPPPDWSRSLNEYLTSTDPAQADQAMREFTDWARDASGLRAQLGPHADEIFRLADQAQSAAVQNLLRQLPSGGKPKGMPAPLPPRQVSAVPVSQFVALASLWTVFLSAPGLIKSHPGKEPLIEKESDEKIGDNAVARIRLQPRVNGSQAEIDVNLTIRAEKDGAVYEEKGSGKITITVCPDEQGNVLLDLSLQSAAGAGDAGLSLQFSDHAIGHVDDEGNLTSIDHELKTEVSLTQGKHGLTGGVESATSKLSLQFRQAGLTSEDPKQRSITLIGGDEQRAAPVPGKDVVDKAVAPVGGMALGIEEQVFREAERTWQNGYCVAINVPEGQAQQVMTRSETPFTAIVRHQFEGKELTVPVIATLVDGMVSVKPSETKVPAPATFTYLAPMDAGEEATVELVSRSRRGIGKLTIKFQTKESYYYADTLVGVYFKVPVWGSICALDKPFTLKADGYNPSGGAYIGTFEFTPSGTEGGKWKHAATSCIKGGKCGSETGSGTYQIEGVSSGKPVIKMNATTERSAMDGYAAEYAWPAWEIPLDLLKGKCEPIRE